MGFQHIAKMVGNQEILFIVEKTEGGEHVDSEVEVPLWGKLSHVISNYRHSGLNLVGFLVQSIVEQTNIALVYVEGCDLDSFFGQFDGMSAPAARTIEKGIARLCPKHVHNHVYFVSGTLRSGNPLLFVWTLVAVVGDVIEIPEESILFRKPIIYLALHIISSILFFVILNCLASQSKILLSWETIITFFPSSFNL